MSLDSAGARPKNWLHIVTLCYVARKQTKIHHRPDFGSINLPLSFPLSFPFLIGNIAQGSVRLPSLGIKILLRLEVFEQRVRVLLLR